MHGSPTNVERGFATAYNVEKNTYGMAEYFLEDRVL